MCQAEEADQKLDRHMIQCVSGGIKQVVIRTVDTDVLVLLIANRHYAGHFESNVYAYFGIGTNKCYYDINAIALQLGENTCQAMPFFHAFSGCDCVSSFFNQGKCKIWDRWQNFDDTLALTSIIFSYFPIYVHNMFTRIFKICPASRILKNLLSLSLKHS